MKRSILAILGAGFLAGMLLVALGVFAATAVLAQTPTPGNPAQSFLQKVAKNLNIDVAKLTDALKKAELDTVDEELAAGKLTPDQAARLKDQINKGNGNFPFPLGAGFPGGRDGGPGLLIGSPKLIADALGMSEADLQAARRSGKSLVEIAADRKISRDDLISKLVAAETKQIDDALAAGKITADQAAKLKANLKDRISAQVDAKPGTPPPGSRPGRGPAGPAPGRPQRSALSSSAAYLPFLRANPR